MQPNAAASLEQHLRGRVGLAAEVQAAMALAHRERPGLAIADVRPAGSRWSAPDLSLVRLRVGAELVEVQVRVEQTSTEWLTCQAERAVAGQCLPAVVVAEHRRSPLDLTRHYASPVTTRIRSTLGLELVIRIVYRTFPAGLRRLLAGRADPRRRADARSRPAAVAAAGTADRRRHPGVHPGSAAVSIWTWHPRWSAGRWSPV